MDKIPKDKLKREKKTPEDNKDIVDSVSAAIGKLTDYAFNPSREKIREMTVIDRMQGRLLPQLDIINMMRGYCLQIATYRQDKEIYKKEYNKDRPEPPDVLDEFMYRLAQWSKSIGGRNLEKATDIALAEVEVRGEGESGFGQPESWE